MRNIVLEKITEEIERRFNCKVISIDLFHFFGTPNVQCSCDLLSSLVLYIFAPTFGGAGLQANVL